jgi:hypothetical protein
MAGPDSSEDLGDDPVLTVLGVTGAGEVVEMARLGGETPSVTAFITFQYPPLTKVGMARPPY